MDGTNGRSDSPYKARESGRFSIKPPPAISYGGASAREEFAQVLGEISQIVGRITGGDATVLAAPKLFDEQGRYLLGAQGGSLGASVIALSLFDAAGVPLSRSQLLANARHEVIHFLRTHNVIDSSAWRVFEAEAPKWRELYGIDGLYAPDGLSNEQLNEEATATAYAEWAARRLSETARTRRPFRQMDGFYSQVREIVQTRSGPSIGQAHEWFARIELGIGRANLSRNMTPSEIRFSSSDVEVTGAQFARDRHDKATLDIFDAAAPTSPAGAPVVKEPAIVETRVGLSPASDGQVRDEDGRADGSEAGGGEGATLRITPVRILLGYNEGGHAQVSIEAGDEASTIYARANEVLAQWAESAPSTGGYNKTDFTIVFADGEEYSGRLDMKGPGLDDRDMDLSDHVREFVDIHTGRLVPPWMSEEKAAELLRAMKNDTDAMVNWRDKYALGDLEIDQPQGQLTAAPCTAAALARRASQAEPNTISQVEAIRLLDWAIRRRSLDGVRDLPRMGASEGFSGYDGLFVRTASVHVTSPGRLVIGYDSPRPFPPAALDFLARHFSLPFVPSKLSVMSEAPHLFSQGEQNVVDEPPQSEPVATGRDPTVSPMVGLTMDAIADRLGYGGWTSHLTTEQIDIVERIFDAQDIGPVAYSERLEALTSQMETLERDRLPDNRMRNEPRWHVLAREREQLQERRAATYRLTGSDLVDAAGVSAPRQMDNGAAESQSQALETQAGQSTKQTTAPAIFEISFSAEQKEAAGRLWHLREQMIGLRADDSGLLTLEEQADVIDNALRSTNASWAADMRNLYISPREAATNVQDNLLHLQVQIDRSTSTVERNHYLRAWNDFRSSWEKYKALGYISAPFPPAPPASTAAPDLFAVPLPVQSTEATIDQPASDPEREDGRDGEHEEVVAERPSSEKPDLLTADRSIWERAIWDAANARWDRGRDVTFGTSTRGTRISTARRDAMRFMNERVEVYEGRHRGRELWTEMGPIGQAIDSLAAGLGLPTSYDRTMATPSVEEPEPAGLTTAQMEFSIARLLDRIGEEGQGLMDGLTVADLQAVRDSEDPAYLGEVEDFMRQRRPDLFHGPVGDAPVENADLGMTAGHAEEEADRALLDGLPEGSSFARGNGLAAEKWAVVDVDGNAIWNYHETKTAAVAAAKQRVANLADIATRRQQQVAQEADISRRLLAGEPLTDADLRTLDLHPSARFEWLSPVAQRLFGLSKRVVRDAMGDALRRGSTDGGSVIWFGDPRRALANAAAYVSASSRQPEASQFVLGIDPVAAGADQTRQADPSSAADDRDIVGSSLTDPPQQVGAKPVSGDAPIKDGASSPGNMQSADVVDDTRSPAAADAAEEISVIGASSSSSFAILSQDDLAPSNQMGKVAANLAALRLLNQLEAAGRFATPDEQRVLARYSGWGHTPQIFDESKEGEWASLRVELGELLTDEEFAAARLTTLNAHYTSHEVVSAVWQGAAGLGFTGGRVLEPGCGIGNFIGAIPASLSPATHMVGIELDPTTAAIARHLYPSAEIRAEGFEATKLAAASFDLMIGNVPFGKIALHDPVYNKAGHTLHNYFIVKSMALAKPGAVMAMVTSRYTMDARNPSARRDIADHADLLGAVRLPETAFRVSAGTDVVTDILFFRKRHSGEVPLDESWISTTAVSDIPGATPSASGEETGNGSPVDSADLPAEVFINSYFVANPRHVLGDFVLEAGMLGPNTLTVKPRPGILSDQLSGMIQEIVDGARQQGRMWDARAADQNISVVVPVTAPRTVKEGAFLIGDDGQIKIKQNGYAVDAKVPAKDAKEVRTLIAMRDAVHEILVLQSQDDYRSAADGEEAPPWAETQARLNALYDGYAAAYGPLNRYSSQGRGEDEFGEEIIRRRYPRMGGFRADPDFATVIALELFDDEQQIATKAPIFSRRILNAPREIRGADDAHGALMASLELTGAVDLRHMANLLGTSQNAVIAELSGAIYRDPTTDLWLTADDYLSGNVRVKLRAAEAAAEEDSSFVGNVEALRKVQPRDLSPHEIKARLGAPWIPADDVEAFIQEIISDEVSVRFSPEINTWSVAAPSKVARSPVSRTVWGTTRRDALTLLEDALNGRPTEVFDQFSDGRRAKNPKATLDAAEKREKLSETFSTWLWKESERADRLARLYNETYNATVLRTFNGAHLRLPGLSTAITPRPHQLNVAWRIVQDGNTLMAHRVGAGKTLASIIGSQEEKRIGLVKKPAFVVPNHMLEQFTREFKQAYPAANLLLADRDEMSAAARKTFVAKCALGDWDAVIFTHSGFGRIPVSAKAKIEFIREQAEHLAEAIRNSAEEDGRRSPSVKNLERAKKNLEERLKGLLAAENKDNGLTFEQTGIDRLYVDELHLFKNLAFQTRRPGVSAPASQRAEDLYLKKEILEAKAPGRSLVGMTGTPIANRVAEMYIMQRYFDRSGLEARGIGHFDAWAATFGEDVTSVELAPDGASFRMSTRFAKYINTPELLTQFRQFTDVQTADMLKLPVPAIKGGKPRIISIPASDMQKAYIADIQRRMEKIRNREVDPWVDNMLKVTSDGRKAATDVRLLGLPADPAGGKAAVVAEQVSRIYEETKDWEYPASFGTGMSPNKGALQLVFCDLGTPKADGSFSMYDAIKEASRARGVPADRIRFIHDYDSDDAKARLFADCRAGRVSVLIGSTEKMGVGTNVQDRLYAIHHVDCPWRPSDIEQRDGRKDRQGNLHYDLGIETETLIYGTEGTFDVYMWQAAERKARFIAQIMKGDLETREIEDIDGQALSYAEAKAILTGNPILMEKAAIDSEVAKLQRMWRNFHDGQQQLRRTISFSVARIAGLEREIGQLTDTLALRRLPADDASAAASVPLSIQGFDPAEVSARFSARPIQEGTDTDPETAHSVAVQGAAARVLVRTINSIWTKNRLSTEGYQRFEIGSYAGLPIVLEVGGKIGSDNVRISLTAPYPLSFTIDATQFGKNPTGVTQLAGLAYLVRDLPTKIERSRAEIVERQTAIEQAEAALGGTFEHQALLDAKLERQADIDAILAVDMPVVGLDATGGADMSEEQDGDIGSFEPTVPAVYDARVDFDPRDQRSYDAGANKAMSFIHFRPGETTPFHFEAEPFCRELGRAADDGNRARALGLVHACAETYPALLLDLAATVAGSAHNRGSDFRGKEAAREFVVEAAGVHGWGRAVDLSEATSADGWTKWATGLRHDQAATLVAGQAASPTHMQSRLLDALLDEPEFAVGVMDAASRLTSEMLGGKTSSEVVLAVLAHIEKTIGTDAIAYGKAMAENNRSDRDRFFKRPCAIQRSLYDSLASDEERRDYDAGHAAFADKQAEYRRNYRYSAYPGYAAPPPIAPRGEGLLDSLRAAATARTTSHEDAANVSIQTTAEGSTVLSSGGTAIRGGSYVDLLSAFTSFARERPSEDPHETIRDFILSQTAARGGVEVLVAYDAASGKVVAAGTNDLPHGVKLPAVLSGGMADAGANIVLHHSHPNGFPLSELDLHVLGYWAGVSWIVSHGRDGAVSAASVDPSLIATHPEPSERAAFLHDAHRRSSFAAAISLELGPQAEYCPDWTPSDVEKAAAELAMRHMDAIGALQYFSTHDTGLPHAIDQQLLDALRAATAQDMRYTWATRLLDGIVNGLPAPEGRAGSGFGGGATSPGVQADGRRLNRGMDCLPRFMSGPAGGQPGSRADGIGDGGGPGAGLAELHPSQSTLLGGDRGAIAFGLAGEDGAVDQSLAAREERLSSLLHLAEEPDALTFPLPFYETAVSQIGDGNLAYLREVAQGDERAAARTSEMLASLEALRVRAAVQVMRNPDSQEAARLAGVLPEVSSIALDVSAVYTAPADIDQREDDMEMGF